MSRPFSIAVDLDGVLTESPRVLASEASERFGVIPERAFVDSAGIAVPEDARTWVYSADGPASRLAPAAGAQEFVRALLARCPVRIITARAAAAAEMTEGWLRANGFPEIAITYADDKPAAAKQHACTHAVEDSERHARSYAAAGVHCFLLADGNGELPSRITRAVDLGEVAAELHGLIDARQQALPAAVRPRIVIADQIDAAARQRLADDADLIDVDGTDLRALLGVIGDVDALIVRSETNVTAEILAAAPKLRVVARAGVGVDNIDVSAATGAGVLVLNAPGANRYSAAEHTVALLLAVTRQLVFAHTTTTAGEWKRRLVKPIDLRGRTVGIVGLGRVGSVVAERLRAFGMTVLAHDPYVVDERFSALLAERVQYRELLERSDVVSFHVPSTSETHHLLDADALSLMRKTAIVLNVARGEIVDEHALAAALHEGRIAGAGVDVFSTEPCTESPLFGAPNIVLTPHTGGSSAEALMAVGDMIAETALAALRGEAVANAVNLPPSTVSAGELQRLTIVAAAAGKLLSVLTPSVPTLMRVTVNGLVPDDVTSHVTAAAAAGALTGWSGSRVTPVNAQLVAAAQGLRIAVNSGTSDPTVEPSFSFDTTSDPPRHVRVSWDRHTAGIVEIDRFSLDRPLTGDVLITHHTDVPGVIGRVSTVLGRHGVNIAGMQVGRHDRGGEAIMVVNVDDEIPQAALDEIVTVTGIATALRVSLPQ